MSRSGRNTKDGETPGNDANVVPFPRDWIGPRDEVRPLRSVPDPETKGPTPDLFGAHNFWGGDADQMQQPVAPAPRFERLDGAAPAPQLGPIPIDQPPGADVRIGSGRFQPQEEVPTAEWDAQRSVPPTRRLRWLLVACVVLGLLGALVPRLTGGTPVAATATATTPAVSSAKTHKSTPVQHPAESKRPVHRAVKKDRVSVSKNPRPEVHQARTKANKTPIAKLSSHTGKTKVVVAVAPSTPVAAAPTVVTTPATSRSPADRCGANQTASPTGCVGIAP